MYAFYAARLHSDECSVRWLLQDLPQELDFFCRGEKQKIRLLLPCREPTSALSETSGPTPTKTS